MSARPRCSSLIIASAALFSGLLGLCVGGPARAEAPASPAVDASGPRLPVDGARSVGVESARLQPGVEGRLSVGYAHRPLVWTGPSGQATALISGLAGATGSLALTAGPLRAGLSMPVAAAVAGDGRATGGAVGDPGLDLKARLLDRDGLALAALGRLTAPLGAVEQSLGSAGPTGGLGLVAEVGGGRWVGVGELGYRALRAADAGQNDASGDVYDDRLRLNLGLSAQGAGPKAPALSVELLSERQLNELGAAWRGSPVELLLGGQLSPAGAAGPRLRGALGAGLSPGVGAPVWRLVLGAGARAALPPLGQPSP